NIGRNGGKLPGGSFVMVDCQLGAAMQAAAQENVNRIAVFVTLFIFACTKKHTRISPACVSESLKLKLRFGGARCSSRLCSFVECADDIAGEIGVFRGIHQNFDAV